VKKPLFSNKDSLPGQTIPGRIVIGVTGHRNLKNIPQLQTAVRSILPDIRKMAPDLKATPVIFNVLTPLAEGADRLIAQEVLKQDGATLEVVLPLPRDNYIKDFSTEDSVREFDDLLAKAGYVQALPAKENRVSAYELAGRYVVEHCDILIALWDGQPSAGPGGTGDIVRYARDIKCPLVWINPADPAQVMWENTRDFDAQVFHDLDAYNSTAIDARRMALRIEQEKKTFQDSATRSGLPAARISTIVDSLIGYYIRADDIAVRFQHAYYQAESWVYVFALLAVITAITQIQFFPQYPVVLIAEIVFLFAMQLIVIITRNLKWQGKWIDSRFLAERFRTAVFMAAANFNVSTPKPPRYLSLSYSPKDWMVAAFMTVWEQKPHLPALPAESAPMTKKFLAEAWLDDQIKYFEKTARRYQANHRRINYVNYTSFVLTIIIILISVLGIDSAYAGTTLSLLAVIFPAFASTLVALRTRRDYQRISRRYLEMVNHLTELKHRMLETEKPEDFYETVKEIEDTMLHENEDWRVVVRFKKTEAPVK
jgi:hypothetical protein